MISAAASSRPASSIHDGGVPDHSALRVRHRGGGDRPAVDPLDYLAIALVSWPAVTRFVGGEFLATRQREFVQACRTVSMGDGRIIFRQTVPNDLPPIIVTASVIVATAILTESAVAFLGLGDPNTMSRAR